MNRTESKKDHKEYEEKEYDLFNNQSGRVKWREDTDIVTAN